jgi:hypothetical protein
VGDSRDNGSRLLKAGGARETMLLMAAPEGQPLPTTHGALQHRRVSEDRRDVAETDLAPAA